MLSQKKCIGTICQRLGMSEDAIGYVINLRGPLCRTCLQDWGASEDDFDRPAVRRAHFLELVPF